jgi:two-component system sensor histidine kinase CpxA
MYMITLLAAIAFVYSFVAAGITTPLRSLATAAEEFGRGNMAVRVTCRRRDEIGNLARSFNAMADRINCLLIAERQLLQDVSHELRSPLARIAFAAELARTADNRDAAIDRLNNELRGITKLVASLLDVTTIEGDPASIKTEETEIAGIIDACVKSCALQAEAQRCRIHVVGNSSRPVRCNRELLRRAFDNVIRNAIQYSRLESDIEVSLADDDSWVVASVRDHGSGVPGELLSRIFEPFFRVDAARDAATGGVGLGLSIVRRIVLLHHGTVTAENSLPGLRVRIAIPAVSVSEAKPESPQSLARIA